MSKMNLRDAVALFMKTFPGKRVIGYWVKPDGYVLNTKTPKEMEEFIEPGQFMVTFDGKVYGTNPMSIDLDMSDYKRI